jgi:type 1 fimbria pilin
MKKKYIPLIFLVCLLLVLAGCTAASKSNGTNPTVTGTVKPGSKTVTPTQTTGSIQISSSPWGAEIYYDGLYRGTTPKTLTDVPIGKHQIELLMTDYARVNGTVDVKAGQTASFSKTLTQLKPNIKVNISQARWVYATPCKWVISGTVWNEGDIEAKNLNVTVEMTAVQSGYKKVSETYMVGTLFEGLSKQFYMEVDVDCGADYKGTIKYDYFDKYEKKYSGSVKL